MKSRKSSPSIYLGTVDDRRSSYTKAYYGVSNIEDSIMYEGDTGHYRWQDPPLYSDVGGPFHLVKRKTERSITPIGQVWTGRNGSTYNDDYYGAFCMQSPVLSLTSGETSPAAWGAEAYAKMKPTKPIFSAVTSLGELRELPSLLRHRTKSFLDTFGSNYLRAKFGVQPLVRDIVNLLHLQQNAQNQLKQLLRDEGRLVRRRVSLYEAQDDPITTVHVPSYVLFAPVLHTYFYSANQTMTTITRKADRVWASAGFRFFFHRGVGDVKLKRNLIARLQGGDLTLAQVYNLIPWSWLIDYFTNLGDLIENLDNGVADRLAAQYFYVMRERAAESESFGTISLKHFKTGSRVDFSGTGSSVASVKRRLKGDPFGLATNQENLSVAQLAILGALGLSRVN